MFGYVFSVGLFIDSFSGFDLKVFSPSFLLGIRVLLDDRKTISLYVFNSMVTL